MIIYGEIQKGQVILSEMASRLEKQFLNSCKDGTRIKRETTKVRIHKTYQQVKAHFGLVVEMVRQRLIEMDCDICGVAPNKEMVHEILKRSCGGVGDMGEVMGLSQMNIEQASRFFENCRTWAATQLSLDIPNPDPQWREKVEKYG